MKKKIFKTKSLKENVSSLSNLFSKYYGCAPKGYQNHKSIEKSIQLTRHTFARLKDTVQKINQDWFSKEAYLKADFEKMKGDFEVNGHEDKERTEQNMIKKSFETFYDLHRVTEILSSLGH